MSQTNLSQIDFDRRYITANEIAKRLHVTRQAVHFARTRGTLPEPILVGPDMIYIWDRQLLEPHLAEWKRRIQTKQGIAA